MPPIPELSTVNFKNDVGFENYQIKAHELDSRFDASYHIPQIAAIEKLLTQNSTKVLQLGSKEISSAIILPGRFKRTLLIKIMGLFF